MSTLDPPAVAGHYLLSEDAYVALMQLRERVRLLALLAAPRSAADDRPEATLAIPVPALAENFQHLLREIDTCVKGAGWRPASR